MDTVYICDESIVVLTDIDQEDKLLIMVSWQFFDIFLEVVEIFDRLVKDLLLWNFLFIKLWLF